MSTQNNHPNNNNQPPPRKNPSNPACAACRSRRQKCAPGCILAPYFPRDRQQQFQNVRKLFGVSFITKTIKDHDDQEEKDEAMASIIYEAHARARDPAGGCSRILIELEQQIREAEREFQTFLDEKLKIYTREFGKSQGYKNHGFKFEFKQTVHKAKQLLLHNRSTGTKNVTKIVLREQTCNKLFCIFMRIHKKVLEC
ncbi:lateral organ boundaries domain-containing protein [Artemisia annua]|uniref:Lateral organ boundaries domain-containing protein n=1 Tax=Artemisia annua TaxID=35608 RepID=A0A2U1NHZ6_ARTAN|nr:lateral organ boundaries domain-containing protein [Artemisia annua]